MPRELAMIPVTSFAGKTVAVFGLGGSGLASCHALKAGGAKVIAACASSKSAPAAKSPSFQRSPGSSAMAPLSPRTETISITSTTIP